MATIGGGAYYEDNENPEAAYKAKVAVYKDRIAHFSAAADTTRWHRNLIYAGAVISLLGTLLGSWNALTLPEIDPKSQQGIGLAREVVEGVVKSQQVGAADRLTDRYMVARNAEGFRGKALEYNDGGVLDSQEIENRIDQKLKDEKNNNQSLGLGLVVLFFGSFMMLVSMGRAQGRNMALLEAAVKDNRESLEALNKAPDAAQPKPERT